MTSDAYVSYYEILGVSESASIEDIKTSFRKLAMECHPDRNNNSPESEAGFKVLNNAYGILSDPEKRGEYNAYLRTSGAFNRRKKPGGVSALIAGGRQVKKAASPLSALFSQLNSILWDCSDLLEAKGRSVPDEMRGGEELWRYVLKILAFMDQWVLTPGGYPDYFLQARKMGGPNVADYVKKIGLETAASGHAPFISLRDYFYNVRMRMDRFLAKTTAAAMESALPGTGVRLMDCALEALNLAVHYLSFINRAAEGDQGPIPPFTHSDAKFEEGADDER